MLRQTDCLFGASLFLRFLSRKLNPTMDLMISDLSIKLNSSVKHYGAAIILKGLVLASEKSPFTMP